MRSKTTFVVGLAITFVGGLIVYSALTPGDDNITSNPQVAGSTNTGSILDTLQPTSGHIALAPDFNLKRLDGGTIKLSDYRGKKSVILDFWMSWCPNCQRDMPVANRLYEKYKNQVEIIGINMRESTSVAQSFVNSRNISFPIAMDNGRVASQYNIRYTHTHVFIDRNGGLVQVIPGDLRESQLLSLIQ